MIITTSQWRNFLYTDLSHGVHVSEVGIVLGGGVVSISLQYKLHVEVLPVTGRVYYVTVDTIPRLVLYRSRTQLINNDQKNCICVSENYTFRMKSSKSQILIHL